jgi:DNA-binding CsgD family transcriptional regulator
MMSPMSMAVRVTDGSDRLDARTFRALLVFALARSSEGMLACDEDDAIVFVCPRASRLVERCGALCGGVLPESLANLLVEARTEADPMTWRRLPGGPSGGAINVRITMPAGIPGIGTVFWLREEIRRDDRLYAALNEQYGLSRRAFQLALLVRQGLTNRAIASELRLSEATVKVYLHQLYRACGAASRTALIALMDRAGEHG